MEDNPNAQKHKNNTLLSSLMDLSMIVKEEAEKDKFVLMQIRKQALDRQIAGHEATITSHDGEQARLNIKFRALAKRYVFSLEYKYLLFNVSILIFFSWDISYEAASRDYKVNENLLKKHQRVLKKGEGDLKAIVERINTKQLIVSKVN